MSQSDRDKDWDTLLMTIGQRTAYPKCGSGWPARLVFSRSTCRWKDSQNADVSPQFFFAAPSFAAPDGSLVVNSLAAPGLFAAFHGDQGARPRFAPGIAL